MSPETTNPLRPSVLLWRGATMRCPVCGRHGVVRHWVGLRERCPRCGFAFERTDFPFSAQHYLDTGHVLSDDDIGQTLEAADASAADL